MKLNVIMPGVGAKQILQAKLGAFIVNHEYLGSAAFSPEFHRGINISSDRYQLLGSVGK